LIDQKLFWKVVKGAKTFCQLFIECLKNKDPSNHLSSAVTSELVEPLGREQLHILTRRIYIVGRNSQFFRIGNAAFDTFQCNQIAGQVESFTSRSALSLSPSKDWEHSRRILDITICQVFFSNQNFQRYLDQLSNNDALYK